jgi:hypothetical protein
VDPEVRCPRDHAIVNLEMCAGRKVRKHHGCGTCTYPKQYQADQERIKGLVVGRLLEPKPSEKYTPLYINGLSPGTIKMSRMVAQDLYNKLAQLLGKR